MEVMQRLVLELADELQGALLYLDAGAAEIAQTTLGVPMLLGKDNVEGIDAFDTRSSCPRSPKPLCPHLPPTGGARKRLSGLGAVHVCSLESASAEDAVLPLLASGISPTHLVVLTTQLLTDTHRRVLHAVLVSGVLAAGK